MDRNNLLFREKLRVWVCAAFLFYFFHKIGKDFFSIISSKDVKINMDAVKRAKLIFLSQISNIKSEGFYNRIKEQFHSEITLNFPRF